ncbi:MAG: hypothetical protein R3F19_32430 [Verrucomicrobiales bacterium]
MTATTVLNFQFGNEEAIWKVARSRSAFWTGLVLVLITSIPRNYDQLAISEHTVRWIFGPLAFSLISGTWTYFVAYRSSTAAGVLRSQSGRQPLRADWMSFMTLFWMTAPIAWLYAIPVERFLNVEAAARANVTLLAIVAGWRVILMSRVLSVVCNLDYICALAWVLVATSAEVFALGFFGGALSNAIMAGMAGMRMSPAEDVINTALANATLGSVPAFLLAITVVGGCQSRQGEVEPLPEQQSSKMPWTLLAVAAGLWIAIAVWPQLQAGRSAKVDQLVAAGRYEEALAFLNSRSASDFAPGRELAPKAYELEIYEQLPAMIHCATSDGAKTAPWVWERLLQKLDIVLSHDDWKGNGSSIRWSDLLKTLAKVPAGENWIQSNRDTIALVIHSREAGYFRDSDSSGDSKEALSILEKEYGLPPEDPQQDRAE